MRELRFGACIPHYGIPTSRKAILDFCDIAESNMYDSIWTTDHIAISKSHSDPYGKILESIVTLTYAAARTKHVQLGTSIIVLPMRNAVIIAKEAASLDVLSEGRLILGVAAGWETKEFEALKANFHERGRIVDEQIRLMKTLWSSDEPKFSGKYHQVSDVLFSPKPVQEGGPPIWIGGDSPATMKRIARLGDGWHAVGLRPDQMKSGRRTIREFSKTDRKIAISIRLPVDISPQASPEYRLTSGETAYMLGGPRETIIREIEKFQDAGVEHIICFFGNRPYEEVRARTIQFANDVIPSFSK